MTSTTQGATSPSRSEEARSSAPAPGGTPPSTITSSDGPAAAPGRAPNEVGQYLRRLVLMIVVGIVLMASTAVWAWNRYGSALDQVKPLPPAPPATPAMR